MLTIRIATSLVLVALVVGCGGGADPAGGIRPIERAAAVDPQKPLPPAASRGVVELRTASRATRLDLATLRGMPQGEVTIREPFRRTTMTFVGVRFSDLLAGGRGTGRRLYLHAIDDYHVELPLKQLRRHDALLAWQVDGRTIPTAAGGPLRVVYPDGAELGRNRDNWIWSVDSMQVRR